MLINLFKNNGQDRIFDSIIIITDRKVLDKTAKNLKLEIREVQSINRF